MMYYLRAIVVVLSLVQCFGFRQELDEDWKKFKNVFNKRYLGVEENARRAFFEKHVELIAKHNRDHDLGLTTFTLGLNEYADMSNFEFRKFMNGFRMQNRTLEKSYDSLNEIDDLPSSVDWRKKGIVTDIKNQEQCGSCWAFSTTGSVEGQHALKSGNLVSVSEQNLVDCSTKYGNEGCNGGLMDQAFKYIINNHGIDTEASYPYEAQDGKCRFKKNKVGATISKYVDVPSGNERALQQAVASVGPVSVAIDASSPEFQLYKSGIFHPKRCSTTELDHGVLVVGYGSEEDGDFWIVKNSWGLTWGNKGYILMARNKDNECGIATSASYPLV